MPNKYDVILIGGNVPNLTAAAYLGKAGLKTIVLEKSSYLGGTAICTEMNVPGHRFCPAATGEFWAKPKIVNDLGLDRHGLGVVMCTPNLTTTFGDGNYLRLYTDPAKTAEEIARFSEHDAEQWVNMIGKWRKIGQFMGLAFENQPASLGQMATSLASNKEMKALGRDLFFATTKDILDRYFESPYTKGAIMTLLEGGDLGPSGAPFFFGAARAMNQWGFVDGGLDKLASAHVAAAKENGADLVTEKNVVKVLVKDNKAYGVVTEDGEEFLADTVLSAVEPLTMYNTMIDEEDRDADFMEALGETVHQNGGGSTLNLALSGLPDFGFPEECYNGFFGITTPGYDYAEDAFCAYNKGEIPDRLMSMSYMPSYVQPGVFAPEGKHTLTAYVFPVPYELKTGTWETRKDEFFEKWIDSLNTFAPGIKDLVIGYEGFTPLELQQKFGMTRGDIQHGTFRWVSSLDHRPAVGYANYRTPIEGLYMGGNSTWPTSGLIGVNGWNVSQAILKDLGRN